MCTELCIYTPSLFQERDTKVWQGSHWEPALKLLIGVAYVVIEVIDRVGSIVIELVEVIDSVACIVIELY